MNLLRETVEVLTAYGRTSADVQWVGGNEFWFTWDEFAELADREYDEGFGGQEVAIDLVVAGDGWHLERGEYDGSEWWRFVEPLARPADYRKPRGLFADIGWDTLKGISEESTDPS